jgi:hypothetical protein
MVLFVNESEEKRSSGKPERRTRENTMLNRFYKNKEWVCGVNYTCAELGQTVWSCYHGNSPVAWIRTGISLAGHLL